MHVCQLSLEPLSILNRSVARRLLVPGLAVALPPALALAAAPLRRRATASLGLCGGGPLVNLPAPHIARTPLETRDAPRGSTKATIPTTTILI